MNTIDKRPTQEKRILDELIGAGGDWVSGNVFLRQMYISQFHARIWSLQKKGWVIEVSKDFDGYGFKRYRIADTQKLFEV